MAAVRMVSPANNPTRFTGGPASSRNPCSSSSWLNRLRFVPETYSPHTLRLGNPAFSMTAAFQPARPNISPAEAPAGPPPIIIASKSSVIPGNSPDVESPRHKTVTEQARLGFLQLPFSVYRPHGREFVAHETGSHAGHRVVPGHAV